MYKFKVNENSNQFKLKGKLIIKIKNNNNDKKLKICFFLDRVLASCGLLINIEDINIVLDNNIIEYILK